MKSNIITVSKANRILINVKIPNTIIRITNKIPAILIEKNNYGKAYKIFYNTEAQRIVKALRQSLPGGTFHEVLVEMLKAQLNIHSTCD